MAFSCGIVHLQKEKMPPTQRTVLYCGAFRKDEISGGSNSSRETFSQNEHDRILTELIKGMRIDLYKSKKVNDGYPQIGISGKIEEKNSQFNPPIEAGFSMS